MRYRDHAMIIAAVTVLLMVPVWLRGGMGSIYLDTDLGRDLHELSNIALHKVVWLGPHLNAGFHASPAYYYLFYPFVRLAGMKAAALVYANMGFAALVLLLLGSRLVRATGMRGLMVVVMLGLSPWWIAATRHPGNGFTYCFWLLLGLTGLWFELPLFAAALAIGLALAYHPAALFGIPILVYEWWRRGHRPVSLFIIGGGLVMPWLPIIAFEVITKGYMTRLWLANPSTAIHLQLSTANLAALAAHSGLALGIGVILWLAAGYAAARRLRIWWLFVTFGLVFFAGISAVPFHYLLGLLTICWFIVCLSLLSNRWGMLVLAGTSLLFAGLLIARPPTLVARSIPSVEAVAGGLTDSGLIGRQDRIAVVAALGGNNLVPQADDYRFLLRARGYEVLDVPAYDTANLLVMVVEDPAFDWTTWSTWEIERFGNKRLRGTTAVNGVRIAVFDKE